MSQANPQHNLDALLIGTGEFMFSENATSIADTLLKGWRTWGNVKAVTPQIESQPVEHFGSYRGVLSKDRSQPMRSQVVYSLKCDEWTYDNLRTMFFGTAGAELTQAIQSAAAADAWAFSAGNPSTTKKWFDVKVSGVRIRKITTLTILTLTEGTDFEVDYLLGRVRFLTNQTTSRTATVTAPAIASGEADAFQSFVPLSDMRIAGFGRLTLFDQDDNNKVVLDHQDFSCEVAVQSAGEISGQDFTEFTLTVTVTADRGTHYIRTTNDT